MQPELTFAVCTYNRCVHLPMVLEAMANQDTDVNYEILVIDNNSSDDTEEAVSAFSRTSRIPVRYVFEKEQGIIYARNRAIEESLDSEFLLFVDDDEKPNTEFVRNAYYALKNENAECVGGKINVVLPIDKPRWFSDDLYGFLGVLDHGDSPFWIEDKSTPVWSGNIGYRTEIFRANPDLRFDRRYNRAGQGIGGGSDAIMFWRLLDRDTRIRYVPDMVIEHYVEEWKITRSYFVKLHYRGGVRYGRYRAPQPTKTISGAPRYLFLSAFKQSINAVMKLLTNNEFAVREAMNAAYSIGTIKGFLSRANAD